MANYQNLISDHFTEEEKAFAFKRREEENFASIAETAAKLINAVYAHQKAYYPTTRSIISLLDFLGKPNDYNISGNSYEKTLYALKKNYPQKMTIGQLFEFLKNEVDPNLSDSYKMAVNNIIENKMKRNESEIYREKVDGAYVYYLLEEPKEDNIS